MPISVEADLSVETWLQESNYPEWRRQELREVYDKLCLKYPILTKLREKEFECKCFIKDEKYQTISISPTGQMMFKMFRAIYSRTDEFKVVVGPYFHQIDKILFSRDEFIKTVPVSERPEFILNYFGDLNPIYETDYSAFESHFDPDTMLSCEMQLYRFLTKCLPFGTEIADLIETAMTGDNICVFRDITVKIPGRRMSGEMCTSSGNGFSNMMFCYYVAHVHRSPVKAIFEGDDALIWMPGMKQKTFTNFGLRLKMEQKPNVNSASFCGMIFDTTDLCNIADPVKIILHTGWTNRKYCLSKNNVLLSLMRAKGMSLMASYPGCPIIQSFAQMILRLTRGRSVQRIVDHMDMWEREKFLMIPAKVWNCYKAVGTGTRLLMEDVFHISIDQQLRIEEYFDQMNYPGPIPFNLLQDIVSAGQTYCYNTFVVPFPATSEIPSLVARLS